MIPYQPFRSLGAVLFRTGLLLLAVCITIPALAAPAAPPAAPTGLAVQAVADNAIHIEWLHSGEDLVRFVIYRAPSLLGPFERITSTSRNRRAYTDVDLSPDTEYCYLVEAENNDGGAVSEPACARTLSARPSAPTSVSVSQVEGSPYLNVTWAHNGPTQSITFVIYRQWIPGDVLPLPIDTVAASPFRDRGGRASTQTCYSVSALSLSGESAPSTQFCFTPVFTTVALPTDITAFARSATLVDVAWNLPIYNYATLVLERSVDGGGFAPIVSFEEKALGHEDENLSADTQYCYRLKAINPVSESPYSSPVCSRTPFLRPASPTLTTVTPSGVTGLQVSWEAPVLARHWFEVRRRRPGGVFVVIEDSTTALTLIDSPLDELSEYCYTVRLLNPMYASSPSGEVCATTGLKTPSEVTGLSAAPDPGNPSSALAVAWSAATPSSFTAYEIDVREPEGQWVRSQLTSNIFATLSGLKDATIYEVRVVAVRTFNTTVARSEAVSTSARTFLAHWAGDANGDGSVSLADVTFMTAPAVYGQSTPFTSDASDVSWRLRAVEVGDGDVALLRSDADRSGTVDLFDFLAIAANLGRSVPGAGTPLLPVITSQEHAGTLAALSSDVQQESESLIRLREEVLALLANWNLERLPGEPYLAQNYPNPFNPATVIPYDVAETGPVRLTIVNALGQEVSRLVDAVVEPGRYKATWDAAGFPSGLYLCVLRTGTTSHTRTLTLLR